MQIHIFESKEELGRAAAEKAAAIINEAIAARGEANIVAATGASQFEFLEALAAIPGIPWSKTTFFHLDEYLGLSEEHPASFRRYLRERVVAPLNPGTFHFINGEAEDAKEECRRLGELISRHRIDVAFVGVGENGHLAFNDPPADFDTEEPYLIVELDEDCRKQQLGEGWFETLDDVPRRAISMSIRQILKSEAILCIAPEKRKAKAVKDCFTGEISPMHPASILRTHERAEIYLDRDSASLLELPEK